MQDEVNKKNLDGIINLLKKLIETPSISKDEYETSKIIENFFVENNVKPYRIENNIYVKNSYFDESKPTILLNSHHDTVKPNAGYTKDPYFAFEEENKIFGLGSNDAGGPLVALIAAFLFFYNHKDLKYNLILLASAEEEISGKNGVELALKSLPKIDFGIVGEPTLMQMAIAEKGLLVVDATCKGKSGHAARDEGENAIYLAVNDINWLRSFKFPKVSETLGSVKTTVTLIEAGTQHNVVPDLCKYTIDIRVTDQYNLNEVMDILKANLSADLTPRSMRLNSSFISIDHPIVQSAKKMNKNLYGSPTLSDQALMNFPTVKIGPGDSARSHTADEYIEIDEIKNGINDYIQLLKGLL